MALCLALALSTGMLSLVMLWLGMLQISITATNSAVIYLLIMLPGWWLARQYLVDGIEWERPSAEAWIAAVCLVLVVAAVVFNAVQWPSYRQDALGIYVPLAREIADTKALVPINDNRETYELYPQLITLNYAYVYLVSGWHNPYPAHLIGAALSLAVLPAVALLARQLSGNVAAWAAVFLVMLTPDFGNWASAAYVDLPMAFFYLLGAVFAWSTLQSDSTVDALLAGLMFGLAAWTKNAALLAVGLMFIFVVYGLTRNKMTLKQAMLVCSSLVIVVAPWYLRNLIGVSMLTPDTVWTEDARQTLTEMFILVTLPQNYGLSGLVMTGGVFWGFWHIHRQKVRFLFWWSAPFFVMWFWLASYDPRFVLLFLPFLAVLAGMMVADIWERLGQRRRTPILAISLLLVVILSGFAAWNSVDYKRALLQDPLMTHEEKQQLVQTP